METGIVPTTFHTISRMPSYSYPTRYAGLDYIKPKTILCKSSFPKSIRGLAMWNNFVAYAEKKLESRPHFKSKLK